MGNNKALLNNFYSSFREKDLKGMLSCYHENIRFRDPAFGELNAEETMAMWEMLLSRSGTDLEISYSIISSESEYGLVKWKAEYVFGRQRRKVVNNVSAQFIIENGLITEHEDDFNLWKWSRQALGLQGYILGWTPFFKKSLRSKFRQILFNYMDAQ